MTGRDKYKQQIMLITKNELKTKQIMTIFDEMVDKLRDEYSEMFVTNVDIKES